MPKSNFQCSASRPGSLPWEIIILITVWVIAGQFAPAGVDSIRDIYQANAIASGAAFPLTGPQLAHSIHLGPLWFYILAIPAAMFGSWGSIAFVVFFLSSLKFWLAYVLGKELHSARLGLLFAVFLALPSWSSIQLAIWTHTTVLETTLLLYILILLRSYFSPSTWNWFLTGFCFSLALHAHPTALPFIILLPLAWPSLSQRWHWSGWLLLGIAVPFLPYGVDQLVNGFPDLAALQHYQAGELNPGGPIAMLKLLYSVVVTGPNLFYKTALPAYMATIAIVAHWVLILASLSFCLQRIHNTETKLKQLVMVALALLLTVVVFVALIRARTPWHFAYAPSFVLAFIYAVATTIALKPEHKFNLQTLVSTTIIVLFLAAMSGASYKLYTNSIKFQYLVLYDVKNLKSPWGATSLEIPAFDSKTHGNFLCESAPVVLHGPYAAMVDSHVGMEAEMSCGKRDNILVGGTSKPSEHKHITGVTVEMSRALGAEPDSQVGNVYFYKPLAVSDAGSPIALAAGDKNPPRQPFTGGGTGVQELQLSAQSPNALLVSKPVGRFLTLDIRRVNCNGEQAQLMVSSNYSWLYTCRSPERGTSMKWRVWYVSSAENLIDAVLLPTRMDKPLVTLKD